jgi:hypothetical protein
VPETREIVRVDERAYENRAITRAALLSEIAALCASVEGKPIPEER